MCRCVSKAREVQTRPRRALLGWCTSVHRRHGSAPTQQSAPVLLHVRSTLRFVHQKGAAAELEHQRAVRQRHVRPRGARYAGPFGGRGIGRSATRLEGCPVSRRWQIHTGPFPFVSADVDGTMWLWRITDGHHFTAVTVHFSLGVLEVKRASLNASTQRALETRGGAAVEACLPWREPPCEIRFERPGNEPSYWSGRR